MTDQDTETIDADAVTPRDLTPDEAVTPDPALEGTGNLDDLNAQVAEQLAPVGPDNPVELQPAGDGDPLLAAHGFGLTRERLVGAGRDIASVPVELIDATIRFAEGALVKARLANTADVHLDAIDVDVQVLKAIRKLRLELKTIRERQAARQRLRG